jgi:hypothetical protein
MLMLCNDAVSTEGFVGFLTTNAVLFDHDMNGGYL